MYTKILRQHLIRSDKQNNVSIYRNCCKRMQMAITFCGMFSKTVKIETVISYIKKMFI